MNWVFVFKVLFGIVLLIVLGYLIWLVVASKNAVISNPTSNQTKSTPNQIKPSLSPLINFTTGSMLNSNEYIPLGKYFLVYDHGINIYNSSEFKSNQNIYLAFKVGTPGIKLVLETNNNLASYNANGEAVWSTQTANIGTLPTMTNPSKLQITDQGSLQIVDSAGFIVWDAKTAITPPNSSYFQQFINQK